MWKWGCLLCGLVTKLTAAAHLVWLGSGPGQLWESDWVRELLSELSEPLVEVVDPHFSTYFDRSILICQSGPDASSYLEYFKECQNRGIRFGIILLGDEVYEGWPYEMYYQPQFVIRNYWHKSFEGHPHILCVPLGYKRGFWDEPKPELGTSDERSYVWSFAGQVGKSTRQQMIDALSTISPHHVHCTFQWDDPKHSLSTQQYRDLLAQTLFVPCPRGWWNLDSFRVNEALEMGCIPIVEKEPFDYFYRCYGAYPFLCVRTWDEAPKLIQALLEDRERLEALRIKCYHWWMDYKQRLKHQVAQLVKKGLCQEEPGVRGRTTGKHPGVTCAPIGFFRE